MHCVDLPASSPAEFLSWDDAFLDSVEEGEDDVLWFWESALPFVVVGYGQQVAREVHFEACTHLGVPILRRCSGGGAVVQGPGCLNFGVALRIVEGGPLSTISGTNRFILSRVARAMASLLGTEVSIEGHTDLVLHGADGVARKFSGNAQRRKRRALLFHGTLLLHMDLALISALLPMPSAEPDYRGQRPHGAFVVNTGLGRDSVRAALIDEWGGGGREWSLPWERQRRAMEERYLRSEWHQRR